VGLLGDFFLGKAKFESAFMRELNQALSILLKLVLGNGWSGPEARQSSSTDDTALWRRCDVSARRLLQSFDSGLINNIKR